MTDQAANLVARHDYLPFGEEIPAGFAGRTLQNGYSAPDSVSQRFTGQIRDQETGLDYFNARYFGAALGRFTSPDAPLVGSDPQDPQGWNLYSYTRNKPLVATDPTGHTIVDCMWDACSPFGFSIGGGGGGSYSGAVSSWGLSSPFSSIVGDDLNGYSQYVQNVDSNFAASAIQKYLVSGDKASAAQLANLLGYQVQISEVSSALAGDPGPPSYEVYLSILGTWGTSQQKDVPLSDYAQAVLTHITLQRTSRVITNPCT